MHVYGLNKAHISRQTGANNPTFIMTRLLTTVVPVIGEVKNDPFVPLYLFCFLFCLSFGINKLNLIVNQAASVSFIPVSA